MDCCSCRGGSRTLGLRCSAVVVGSAGHCCAWGSGIVSSKTPESVIHSVCMCVCVRMYECMHACIYVCMYVCTYVRVNMYKYKLLQISV